ncbi:MAG: TIM-barrel domain-containing protein [Phycisphaerales bacterium]
MLRLPQQLVGRLVLSAAGLVAGCVGAPDAGARASCDQGAMVQGASQEAVRFVCVAPAARRVYLAGNFNAWASNVGGTPKDPGAIMTREADGTWAMAVQDVPDIARYKFVVEDDAGRFEWRADPGVAERDRDGNSVLIGGARPVRGAAAADGSSMVDVRVVPREGRVVAVLRDVRGVFHDAVVLPGFAVDGTRQDGLMGSLVQNAEGGEARAGFRGIKAELTIEPISPRAVAVRWRCTQPGVHDLEALVQDNSRYYGGGERFNAINQKGVVLPMGSLDRPEDKGVCSYKPVPFIISSRGYGLWLDSTSPSTFDLNATKREEIKIQDRGDCLRLVLIAGPTPAEILAEFTRLTGRPPVPPAWAFAPWKSRDVHANRDEVLADVELSRQHDLPASVIVLDSPWETGYNNFILNEQQFPRPDEMFGRIRQLGFVPCLWLTPFINNTSVTDMKGIDPGPSSNFQEAVERGYLVKQADGSPLIVPWWKGTGGLVDFTNPEAVGWWQGQLAPTARWGVAAIKCDDGESNFVREARFFDGSRAAAMKGRYAELYLKAAHDFLERHRPGDHTLIARCGFTGTGRFPFGWAGDNEATFSFENGLPGVIVAAQTASLSGLPLWGCDIAGYMGSATPEVFIRWTQFAAFTPLMMVHMQSNKGPWDYGPRALDIYRTYARLHTRLYPYLDNAAHEAAQSGMPLIRPMVLAFADDARAAEERYQYMLGPDLLVAPMYQSGTHRSVYLPKGTWTDYWTGERLTGPATIEAAAPLERMPLYVRDGAVIPMLPDDVDTLLKRTAEMDSSVVALDDRRVIEVWPGERGGVNTHDGLAVIVAPQGGEQRLTLTSDEVRPVDVRLRFVHVDVRIEGTGGERAATRFDGPDTVVSLPAARGEVVLTWSGPARPRD